MQATLHMLFIASILICSCQAPCWHARKWTATSRQVALLIRTDEDEVRRWPWGRARRWLEGAIDASMCPSLHHERESKRSFYFGAAVGTYIADNPGFSRVCIMGKNPCVVSGLSGKLVLSIVTVVVAARRDRECKKLLPLPKVSKKFSKSLVLTSCISSTKAHSCHRSASGVCTPYPA